ncbi:hypothetical protein EJ110_NYTH16959 [Nymphaea thermarum]|nr:hypothetical protein EJ110_NYTH16959 [Nymphaea thermarum]
MASSSAASSNNFFYPYPLNLNVSNFVSLKLTHSNFLPWKTQNVALIESQDMEGFLTGSNPAPPNSIIDPADPQNIMSNLKFESWRRSDRLVKGWITGTLSKSVLGLVVGLNSSQEFWSTLIDAFAQESQERGFHLTHMLTTCKKGDDAFEVYVAKFKAICDDLGATGKSVADKEKAFWLLQGLGKGYVPFVMVMLKPPVPSYKQLVSLLQSLETSRLKLPSMLLNMKAKEELEAPFITLEGEDEVTIIKEEEEDSLPLMVEDTFQIPLKNPTMQLIPTKASYARFATKETTLL